MKIKVIYQKKKVLKAKKKKKNLKIVRIIKKFLWEKKI